MDEEKANKLIVLITENAGDLLEVVKDLDKEFANITTVEGVVINKDRAKKLVLLRKLLHEVETIGEPPPEYDYAELDSKVKLFRQNIDYSIWAICAKIRRLQTNASQSKSTSSLVVIARTIRDVKKALSEPKDYSKPPNSDEVLQKIEILRSKQSQAAQMENFEMALICKKRIDELILELPKELAEKENEKSSEEVRRKLLVERVETERALKEKERALQEQERALQEQERALEQKREADRQNILKKEEERLKKITDEERKRIEAEVRAKIMDEERKRIQEAEKRRLMAEEEARKKVQDDEKKRIQEEARIKEEKKKQEQNKKIDEQNKKQDELHRQQELKKQEENRRKEEENRRRAIEEENRRQEEQRAEEQKIEALLMREVQDERRKTQQRIEREKNSPQIQIETELKKQKLEEERRREEAELTEMMRIADEEKKKREEDKRKDEERRRENEIIRYDETTQQFLPPKPKKALSKKEKKEEKERKKEEAALKKKQAKELEASRKKKFDELLAQKEKEEKEKAKAVKEGGVYRTSHTAPSFVSAQPSESADYERSYRGTMIGNKLLQNYQLGDLNSMPDFSPAPEVSYLVSECVAYLDKKGLKTVGLYRESGSISEMKKLKEEFATKKVVDLTAYLNPHTVAGVLKQYFREMPNPIFPKGCTKALMAAEAITDEYDRYNAFREAMLAQMNKDQFETVRILLRHLSNISVNSGENLMTPPNLAICWAPTLFRGGASVFGIVVNLINGYDNIFQ